MSVVLRPFAVAAIVFGLGSPLTIGAEEPVDFARQIRPILSDTCFHCHGPDQQARQGELRLDRQQDLFGEHSDLIVPGDSAGSELIRRITSSDEFEQMPPPDSNRSLSEQQIELLQRWVDQGAQWKQHWALEPPARPGLPAVANSGWPITPIDHFILARLEQRGWSPSPPASKETLIRRVTLDLTGLPPTLEEIDAFLADDSPQAYENVVDRLLGSQRYGERMVWPWLDAARYADSNGFQGDPERTMWPWRDWVIRALNDNLPFDRFTIEQLAGDLLPDATAEQIVATGFNRNHTYNGEGGRIAEETRAENVMDRTETTATVWLGLTMTCARCHDHKYDPLTMEEYYRLYAFFNNTSEQGGGGGGQIPPVLEYLGPQQRARSAELDRQIGQLAGQVAASETGLFPHGEQRTAADSERAAELPDNLRAALAQAPQQRDSKGLGELAGHFEKDQPDYAGQLAALKQAADARDRLLAGRPKVMVMDERPQPRETFILVGGAYNQAGDRVSAEVPASLPPLPADSPRNRLALARWLVDPQHPLTARVTVNRYWQLFFGMGLVKTAEDFGTQAEPPTHPELLDWLATEFIASGWDVQQLHKQIVMSAVYGQSSKTTPALIERDPENRLLARAPRHRLPSWMIRDQALAASGLLVDTLGGPPVKPYQPAGIWSEATFGKKRYQQDSGESLYRRSVYTFWRRIVAPTMLFDTANRQTCSVSAIRTNTPLHALTTLNDVTYVEAARALAQRLLTGGGDSPAERIEEAFRRLTARRPQPAELDILLQRLEHLRAEFAEDEQAAGRLLAVGQSPRDQRLDEVEHAAYTALCTLILNLDETLTKQ